MFEAVHEENELTPCVRYYLRVTLARRIGEVVKEKELWVHSYRMPPDSNTSIKMEVGIEDCLHIEFEYNKAKWVVQSPSFSNIHSLPGSPLIPHHALPLIDKDCKTPPVF